MQQRLKFPFFGSLLLPLGSLLPLPSLRLPLSPINVLRVSVFFVPSFWAAADASAAFAWSVQNRLKLMMSLDRANEFFIFHFSHAIQWDE